MQQMRETCQIGDVRGGRVANVVIEDILVIGRIIYGEEIGKCGSSVLSPGVRDEERGGESATRVKIRSGGSVWHSRAE